MDDPDPDMILRAVSDGARPRGMAKLAEDARFDRARLYKALRTGFLRMDIAGLIRSKY